MYLTAANSTWHNLDDDPKDVPKELGWYLVILVKKENRSKKKYGNLFTYTESMAIYNPTEKKWFGYLPEGSLVKNDHTVDTGAKINIVDRTEDVNYWAEFPELKRVPDYFWHEA